MAINFQRDRHKSISTVVTQLIQDNREFEVLTHLRFLYTYRLNEPQYIRGELVEAVTKKLSARERDIYERDVEICVYYDVWMEKNAKQKERLIYGQLLRIYVEVDEHLEVALDEDERVKYKIIEPDISVRIFAKELEKYGLPSQFKPALSVLNARRAGKEAGEDE